MATETNPAHLVILAEHTLTAAQAATSILATSPGLPVERLHAEGIDGQGNIGPLLEIQVGDNPDAVTAWANSTGTSVEQTPFLGRTQHRATARIAGITVMVTAYEDADDEYWAS
ncbi:unknown [Streptomyces phage mu1/6]|uniref:hypothetical protein n=1 Tax=Streptomyces phage mu1/6 TaxID=370623 RepID=UPI0000D4F6C5|nr:hypothetical protein SPMV1_gp23 [Streptomyces phage mu1/6]ABD94188.1 unknown [Streptomyces phage mu1/6]